MRQYGLILAAALTALVIGYWLGHSAASPANLANAAQARDANPAITHKPAVAETAKSNTSTRVLASAVSGAASTTSALRNAPLPAPGTPLKDTRAELQARAEAGDAEAASRLFRDTQRCADVRAISTTIPRMAQHALDQKTDGTTPEALRGREQMLANYDKQLSFARENATLCEGLSNDEINQIVPSAMQAALLGDAAAADCYVGTGMFGTPQGVLDHPEWLADYKQNALAIANAAISRGDWGMVHLLATAYGAYFPSSMISQLTGHDPVQAYRYAKLQSLGAEDARITEYLNHELVRMASDLSADAKAAADTWAQQMFQQTFNSTPPSATSGRGISCHAEGSY